VAATGWRWLMPFLVGLRSAALQGPHAPGDRMDRKGEFKANDHRVV